MNTLSDKELENIVGGITGASTKKSTYYDQEDLVCNSCYFEPSKNGLKCLKGDTCPKCHKGTLIYAKG
ncbi:MULTISPECIES: bacteriocin [Butyrivibrio]|jgi:bacteriocin-like protein|uniref:Bacteriocin n=1 Tax=Butyrivibrio fibrisolvens TaxID=831 RepID=A0A317G2E9_BUTFI|nr:MULTISPECIES: bacteriocin [Butyrivibrio]PWT26562.1 bacteriocin [Butyrivibrio fibrisolvens]SEQ28519.1 bacteriocin-type signal sequence-containing protein [Butyrivibrio sp. TB]